MFSNCCGAEPSYLSDELCGDCHEWAEFDEMNLTKYEKNVLLVSLDHMEEHLEEIEYNGVISEDTYNLRMNAIKTARTKINQ